MNAPRQSRRSALRATLAWAGLLCGLLLGFAAPSHAGELKLIVAGPGTVTVSPPGVPVLPSDPLEPLDPSDVGNPAGCEVRELAVGAATGDRPERCLLAYPAGTEVTVTAVPDPGPTAGGAIPSFARWSPLECFAVTQCRVTVGDARETVAATFDPLRLRVAPSGPGSVTSEPAGIACSVDEPGLCDLEVPSGTPVTLTAQPGEPVRWVGCDSAEGPVCRTSAWSDPEWVFPHFGPGEPDTSLRPPRVKAVLRVLKGGDGRGSVRGRNLDCGDSCAAEYPEFGRRERLVATPASGSAFAGWRGACERDPVCVVPVGVVGAVRAIFDADPPPDRTPDREPDRPPDRTPDDQGKPRPRPALSVRVLRLSAAGRGRNVVVVIRVRVNRSARATARLFRGRRVVARRIYRLHPGVNRLRLRVPRRVSAGRARVVLRVSGAGRTRTVVRWVRVRR